MERIAVAMQDGGAGAGAQHGDAGREATSFCLAAEPLYGTPGAGGLFGFKFSSRPHPRKFGVQRFLVVREVAGAVSGVALFWATKPDGGRATRAMRLDDVLTELRPSHGDADHEKDWAAPPSIDENWPRTYARTGPVSGTL